eukprot:c24458_g1_i1 orf=423-1103(+)
MERNYESGSSVFKKKRGRPRKNDTILLPGEISVLGVAPASDGKPRKPKLIHNDVSYLVDAKHTLVGQPVHGVVDGSFDAGYLVTVRVGDSDTVYRGVVFGPGMSIPLSKANDVAPKVKAAMRDDGKYVASPPPSSPTVTAPASVDASGGATVFTVPPAFSGGATAVSRPQHEHEISDIFQQQQFVHQGFVAKSFNDPVQAFRLAQPGFGSGNSQFEAGGQGSSHIS